jgi:hypothetical protein
MTACDLDVVLYFYDEMDGVERARADAHLRGCGACRLRLDDLHAIRRALAARPAVDVPAAAPTPDRAVRTASPTVRRVAALAAMLVLVVTGLAMVVRLRAPAPASQIAAGVASDPDVAARGNAAAPAPAPEQSLRAVSAEHLERSKLVVLGLSTRDPHTTSADDWQYERRLAGSLLSDTRLYRIAAQDRGVADVARVMRDLETVLLEASLSDSGDKDALARVQRLITKRDLVVKMQVMAGSAGL